jgi:hypothetical protein
LLFQPFENIYIGTPGQIINVPHEPVPKAENTNNVRSSITGFFQTPFAALLHPHAEKTTTGVVTYQTGNIDAEFGMPVSLLGQISSTMLFSEALTDAGVKALYYAGW